MIEPLAAVIIACKEQVTLLIRINQDEGSQSCFISSLPVMNIMANLSNSPFPGLNTLMNESITKLAFVRFSRCNISLDTLNPVAHLKCRASLGECLRVK